MFICSLLLLNAVFSIMASPHARHSKHRNGLLKQRRECPSKEWELHENACFLSVNLNLNFDDAAQYCSENFGAHLIVVKSESKLDVIRNAIKTDPTKKLITWV